MTLLPVVERELRVAARRNKTYWLRLVAAATALFVCFWVYLWLGQAQAPIAAGKYLFGYLTILAFAYCLLVGPFITADCVSEEKREGTLGLLFLTELHSLDVVLGKWMATSLAGFYGLLAILPALGIPLLMGGVTPGEYGRTALAVVNAVLFSLTAGMFVSTLSRDLPKAILGSVILILGLAGLVPGLAVVIDSGFFTRPVNPFPTVALASPAYTGFLALDASYRLTPQLYWISLATVQALVWLMMLGTAILMPRVWRESPEEKPIIHRWLWRLGYTAAWRRRFKRRLGQNPVFALAARLRWPHAVFWCLVALVGINVCWFTFGYSRNIGGAQFHVYFSHALVFTNRVWISVMACRFFLEARRTGVLELILTTPLPVRTILRGHWRSLWFLFALPVLAISLLHVFYVTESLRLAGQRSAPNIWLLQTYLISAGSSLVSFITDVFALCYVGGWLSLASRKPHFVVLKTFAFVILIPWTLGYFLPGASTPLPMWLQAYLAANGYLRWLYGGALSAYSISRACCWVLKNLLFVVWARQRLRKHFRAAAAQVHRLGRPGGRWWPMARAGRDVLPALPTPSQAVQDT